MPLLLSHNLYRILHFFYFFVHIWPKKYSFSLKLSSSIYRDDQYGSLNILFFSAIGITTHLLYIKIPSQMEKKNLLSINLFVLLVDKLFLFLCDVFDYFCFVHNLNCHRLFSYGVAKQVFFLFLILGLLSQFLLIFYMVWGINLDNPFACPNLFDRSNSILKS